MSEKQIETFYPANKKQWRDWLEKHHDKKQSIWLVYYKSKSDMPTISWSETVEEALCFGWIDGQAKPIDEEKYMRLFCKRKVVSTWSKINKEKARKLIDEGRMTKAGLASIEIAKQNGSWEILDEVEELTIPQDLEKEFESRAGSKEFFLSLSKSVRKAILQWVALAKQESTRQKRITEIADHASQKLKPKQFR